MNIFLKNEAHSIIISEVIDFERRVTYMHKKSCFWKPFGSDIVNTKRKMPPEICPRQTPAPREYPPRNKGTLHET